MDESDAPPIRLPIYGETPTDALIRAVNEIEGFGCWLFGARPYDFYVNPKNAGPRGTLWELFWFVDEAGDAYTATLGDVELLLRHAQVHRDDRHFLHEREWIESDSTEPIPQDRFKAWHDARLTRFRELLGEAREEWIRRVAHRAGVEIGSIAHGCMMRIADIVPWPETAGVYFVRAGDRVKIGKANNIAKRLATLQTGCPAPLRLMAVAHGARAEESRFHRALARNRIQGEWFLLDQFVLGAIATVLAMPDVAVRVPHLENAIDPPDPDRR